MTRWPAPVLVIALAAASFAGCERTAPAPAPSTPAPTSAPDTPDPEPATGSTAPAPDAGTDGGSIAMGQGFVAPTPAGWRWYAPENRMRAANYAVPAASGESQAHFVVFRGIGGGVDANLQRWIRQFQAPDGGPATPTMSTMEVAGMPATLIEIVGRWQSMGAPAFKPGQRFLGAIIEAPEGDIQIRLAGPDRTVDAQREAFMSVLSGMHRAP